MHASTVTSRWELLGYHSQLPKEKCIRGLIYKESHENYACSSTDTLSL